MAIPENVEAEVALIGSVMLHPEILSEALWLVNPQDFYKPTHQAIWTEMLALHKVGQPIDLVTVPARLSDRADVLGILQSSLDTLPASSRWPHYVDLIVGTAQSRRLIAACSEATTAVLDGQDLDEAVATLGREISDLRGAAGKVPADLLTTDEIVEAADSIMPPEIVSHWLRKGDRTVMVAGEGVGKSYITLQWAMQIGQGVNPLWPTDRMDPAMTLVIDLENQAYSLRERARRIRQSFGQDYLRGMCNVWHRPGGLDLRARSVRAELVAVLQRVQPVLVVLSPLYKAVRRKAGEDHEAVAEAMQEILDDLRMRFDFAVIIEHHAPKGQNGSRDYVPFGSSLWMRWPEYGITLKKTNPEASELQLGRYRGDRERIEGWPSHMAWGTQWPWSAVYRGRPAPWQNDEAPF